MDATLVANEPKSSDSSGLRKKKRKQNSDNAGVLMMHSTMQKSRLYV
jgi:hypothetical protein